MIDAYRVFVNGGRGPETACIVSVPRKRVSSSASGQGPSQDRPRKPKTLKQLKREALTAFIRQHNPQGLVPDWKSIAVKAREAGFYSPTTGLGDIERFLMTAWRCRNRFDFKKIETAPANWSI